MPSQYIVVQYGNLITGEFLNIGVYAYDFDPKVKRVYNAFLTDWSRIQSAFGPDAILDDLVKNWLAVVVDKTQLDNIVSGCNSPYSSLQMTEPRGSLDEPEELIKWAAETFLTQ